MDAANPSAATARIGPQVAFTTFLVATGDLLRSFVQARLQFLPRESRPQAVTNHYGVLRTGSRSTLISKSLCRAGAARLWLAGCCFRGLSTTAMQGKVEIGWGQLNQK